MNYVRKGLHKIGSGFIRMSQWGNSQPTLSGDRDAEWSWVVSRMSQGPGAALDFGCGNTNLAFVAARRGFHVTAIDQLPVVWPYRVPGLDFVRGDLLSTELPLRHYDLILNCSTVEHVGLAGRYGSSANKDGDLLAMKKLLELAKPDATMLMTIPVGCDGVFPPFHRTYGIKRLPYLLDRWTIREEEYWVRKVNGYWEQEEKLRALAQAGSETSYGLGLFVLIGEQR